MDNGSVGINEGSINIWLKEHVIKKLAGKLKQPYESLTWDLSLPENCFYLSCVLFMKVYINKQKDFNGNEFKDESIKLVIKRPGLWMSTDSHFPMASLFHNEILFYKFISHESNELPHFYCYSEDKKNFDNMFIVMENIGIRGYEVCPKSYDIPFEYVISAMETIAKFHAMGYAMKKRQPEILYKLVDQIEEIRFSPGGPMTEFINIIAMRPVEWLRRQNYDKNFVDTMTNYMSDAFKNIMMSTITPEEPLAVLCHGDFTRNNIFFRKTGEKMEGMLFDFAMMRYSSPSIDLSTFLFLSCSNSDRRKRFKEIFQAYHNSLIINLRREGIENLDDYSYEKMLRDYKSKALHGFIILLFFGPIQRGVRTLNPDQLLKFDPVESAKMTNEAGGDSLSEEYAEILLELRDFGCLDHVINF